MTWPEAFAVVGVAIGFGATMWALVWMNVEDERETTKRAEAIMRSHDEPTWKA